MCSDFVSLHSSFVYRATEVGKMPRAMHEPFITKKSEFLINYDKTKSISLQKTGDWWIVRLRNE